MKSLFELIFTHYPVSVGDIYVTPASKERWEVIAVTKELDHCTQVSIRKDDTGRVVRNYEIGESNYHYLVRK